jgi:ketosteroid isomerase-like protein
MQENLPLNDRPFFGLTQQLLDCVRDHNFDLLAELCDDDFGIVDVNEEGGTMLARNRQEWEAWFKYLFAKLDALQAKTWSVITDYQAVEGADMGYSVVNFDQFLELGTSRQCFKATSTIVWKKTKDGWKEARYHGSLLGVEPA